MRKRIMSLILAIAMILAMIPESAFAANGTSGFLMGRRASYTPNPEGSSTPYEDFNNKLKSDFMINEYTEEDIFFYYVDADGNETMLPATSLMSSDDTIVSLSSRSDSMAVHVQALDPATATISYEHTDGVTYTMPMYVVSYGTVGFYEDTSRGTQIFDYYISSLPNDTFYFVPDDAWTLTSVSLDSVSEDFADITLDPSGKFATIEITDTTLKGMSMSSLVVNFDAMNGALISTDNECWMTVNTNSMMPAMGYLSCVAVDDPLGMLGGSIYDVEGTKRAYYFYYTDANGVQTSLTAADLQVADPSVVTINADASNTGAVEVTLNVAGSTDIYYIDGNGDYYSVYVDVSSSMPPTMGSLQCAPVSDTSGMLYGSIGDMEGVTNSYYFYYTDANGMQTQVSATDLTVKDPTVAIIGADPANPGAVLVTFDMAGWTEIYYMDSNGDYYSVSVNVYSAMSPADPSAGFYTDSMGSMQIGDF